MARGLRIPLAIGLLAAAPSAQILNEIRIDQTGTDIDEYCEIAGAEGTNLGGLHLLVIGDGGAIENATALSGTIGASGYFVVATSSYTLSTADQIAALNFENGDNLTVLLVSGFSGSNGQDLDTNDDGTLDATPWTSELDRLGILDEPNPPVGSGDWAYGPTTVGPPSGFFPPAHAFRSPGGAAGLSYWALGDFALGGDTPGAANGTGTVSGGTGGTVALRLDAGGAFANHLYLILLSSGTAGIDLGDVVVPLTFDPLLLYSIESANGPNFVNTFGFLDASGRASAQIVFPGGLAFNGSLFGAAIGITVPPQSSVVYASNAFSISVVP